MCRPYVSADLLEAKARKFAEGGPTQKQLDNKEELLREREQRIEDMINSMSWRITRPLRVVYGMFKKDK